MMKCIFLTVICTIVICDLGLTDEVGSPSRHRKHRGWYRGSSWWLRWWSGWIDFRRSSW